MNAGNVSRDTFFVKLKKRLTLQECSGALGDLGVFLPLSIGLAVNNGLDFGQILIFTGVFNLLTAVAFDIPMPVQPMKTIAAAALSNGLSKNEIMAAGLFVGTVVSVCGVFRLVNLMYRLVPDAIVRGLQLGLGMSLLKKAIGMIIVKEGSSLVWLGTDSILVGCVLFCVTLVVSQFPRFPSAVLLFLCGLILALCRSPDVEGVPFGFSIPSFVWPDRDEWLSGIREAGIGQLAVTLLNSIIAVTQLTVDLFPLSVAALNLQRTQSHIAISVGLMNLCGCLFGSMPACHGSGGLAAQYLYGARSNGAILILGIGKLFLGVVFGKLMLPILKRFPESVLGVLLVFSSIQLCLAAKAGKGVKGCLGEDRSSRLLFLTAGACLAVGTGYGFLLAYGSYLLLLVSDEVCLFFRSRSGTSRGTSQEVLVHESIEEGGGESQ